MKAKYILRGLGLGMIIASVLMGAYTRNAVAEARVEVLKEYGIGEEPREAETLVDIEDSHTADTEKMTEKMTENEVMPAVGDETLIDGDDIKTDYETESYESQAAKETDTVIVMGTVAETDNSQEENKTEEKTEEASPQITGIVKITIAKGDDSGTVSRKLYNAGIVKNAAEFDAFLMQHGYDKKLNTGEKIINAGDTWQEIAEELTK